MAKFFVPMFKKWESVNKIIVFLDIIHRPVFFLLLSVIVGEQESKSCVS
jgi:hypothetical protein